MRPRWGQMRVLKGAKSIKLTNGGPGNHSSCVFGFRRPGGQLRCLPNAKSCQTDLNTLRAPRFSSPSLIDFIRRFHEEDVSRASLYCRACGVTRRVRKRTGPLNQTNSRGPAWIATARIRCIVQPVVQAQRVGRQADVRPGSTGGNGMRGANDLEVQDKKEMAGSQVGADSSGASQQPEKEAAARRASSILRHPAWEFTDFLPVSLRRERAC